MSYLDRINKVLNPVLPPPKEEVPEISSKDELLIKYQKQIDSLIKNEKQPSAIDYQHQKIVDAYMEKINKVTEVKREVVEKEEVKREVEEVKREVEAIKEEENVKSYIQIVHEEPSVQTIIHHPGHLFPVIVNS